MSLSRKEVSDGTVNPLRVYCRRNKKAREQITLNKDDEKSISNLPDDLLIKILGLLDTKTAVSTSILSKGWKNLYHSLTRFSLTLQNPSSDHDEKMIEFTKSIQNILDPNTTPDLKSLTIAFDYFHSKHKALLDACVLKAFSRKLENFELSINSDYTFLLDSLDGLGDSISVQILHICGCALVPQPDYRAFRSLKELTLRDVVFHRTRKCAKHKAKFRKSTNEGFYLLMNGCLNLETFSLIECEFQCVIEINAPNSRLQEINCVDCFNGVIKIASAPKLERLTISNCSLEVDVEPNPSVKYLRLGFDQIIEIYVLDHISAIFPCVETLVLSFEGEEVWLDAICTPSFMKLKHLIVEAKMAEICHPLWISILLEAAPFLETFEINIENVDFSDFQFNDFGEESVPLDVQHKNLKVFKVTGFEGSPTEKDLVRYVIKSATALKEIDVRNTEGYPYQFDETIFSSTF